MGFPEGHPSLETATSYYDLLYRRTMAERLRPWREHAARIVTWYPALALAAGKPLVDVGCGPGVFAEMALNLGARYVWGCDTSAGAIEAAKWRIGDRARFFLAAPGSAWWEQAWDAGGAMLPTPTESAWLFLEVLEHVYDDLGLLRTAPSGATVVASVPSFHTEGHCRWFTTEAEVRQRYGAALDIDQLVVESHQSENWWFIFRGTRRD